MAIQGYSTVPSRNLIRAEMKMLKHAETKTVISGFGDQKQQPQNKTDTVVFRRLNPFNMQANGVPGIDPTQFVLFQSTPP